VRTHLRIDRLPAPQPLPASFFCTPFAFLIAARPAFPATLSRYHLYLLIPPKTGGTGQAKAVQINPLPKEPPTLSIERTAQHPVLQLK
jgi:hypothetical protein